MSTSATGPVVAIGSGRIAGSEANGVCRFLGVPYAAPPFGELRFGLPQPYPAWDGVRDATGKGPMAPQPVPSPEEMEKLLPGLDIAPLVGDGLFQGDDCLLLNIWAPAEGENNPVLLFIHGGAFTGGCGSADVYDGSAFARRGVVCITINYRLGVEGFLPIPGAPTNLGLRDQIAALHWVRDNIAAFGGDPENVTVSGESAGAMSLANLVVSPLARGLFRRAIVQSGHGSMVRPVAVARNLVHKLAKELGITPDLEGFRGASVKDCLMALKKASQPKYRVKLKGPDGREPAYGLSRFLPVYGDDVLPQHPLEALRNGVGSEIDLLIGTNREEMNLYFVPSGVHRKIGRILAFIAVRMSEPQAWPILRAYGLLRRDRKPGCAFTEALTDCVFCLPARRFAQAHQGRTHFYEFGWRSRAYSGELGACHGLELPFVFDTLHTVSGARGLAGEDPPQPLAEHMNALWAEYCKTGVLPWPEYDDERRLVYAPETDATARDRDMPAEALLP
jgi:para-nitrobenzyl esterase